MRNICEIIKKKFLWYQKELLIGATIFIIASLSFGFGYLANQDFNHAPIIIEKCASSTD